MNKKIDKEFIGINDIYFLKCKCTELKKDIRESLNISVELADKLSRRTIENLILSEEIRKLKNKLKKIEGKND